MPEPLKVALISLGCPKNQVDSEVLLAHLGQGGVVITAVVEDADVIVVNTCAFTEEAREEAIDTLFAATSLKEEAGVKGVIAVGCLPQRFAEQVRDEMPEVDAFLPITDYSKLADVVHRVVGGTTRDELVGETGGVAKTAGSDLDRLLLSPSSYAYLRIAEGCSHACSYCSIPLIRGKLASKPRETLGEEARRLAAQGVKELVLVAEDSTAWGHDFGAGGARLADLLEDLDGVDGIAWVRVLYAYPWTITPRLLTVMREANKVVPYMDLPIQHISSPVLEAMGRGGGGERLRDLLQSIREEVPGIALRTSILVGHPRETEKRFGELLEFLADFRFERLGAFTYSPETGTPAATMGGRPSRAVAELRQGQVMELQQDIVLARNESLVGSEMTVLIDGPGEDGAWLGRTTADAPEVDCMVVVQSSRDLAAGELLTVRIGSYEGYDLHGQVVSA